LRVPIIDTDEIARELTAQGEPALREIANTFGESVLTDDGRLNRAALRQRVFKDADERRRLEAILHPLIREEVQRRLAGIRAPYCVVVVPLLIETAAYAFIDRVLVIEAPETTRIARVKQRSGLSDEQIRAIIAVQASPEQRRRAADDVIVNDRDLDALGQEIARLHQHYLQLAADARQKQH
jgi:dephospho-CoA kinase